MYYKAFTNNGEFHVGYLFNETDPNEIQNYFLWSAGKQYEDENISEDEYNTMKMEIEAIDITALLPYKEGDQKCIDGIVEELYITASKKAFPISECEDFQRDLIGAAPWK